MIKKILILLAVVGPFLSYFVFSKLQKSRSKKTPFLELSVLSLILIIVVLGFIRFSGDYSVNSRYNPPRYVDGKLMSAENLDNLLKPNTKLKPVDVLKIQLEALKNNNIPYKNAGIEQTWEFAHPDNKKKTGPLNNFINLIYSKNYNILIGHQKHEFKKINQSNDSFTYEVYIMTKDKKKYVYLWKIEKVKEKGILKNCWMTTLVSSPQFLGDII